MHTAEPWTAGPCGVSSVHKTDPVCRTEKMDDAKLIAQAPAMLRLLKAVYDDEVIGGELADDIERVIGRAEGLLG